MLESPPIFDWQEFNDDVDDNQDGTVGSWSSLMDEEPKSSQQNVISGTWIVIFVASCFMAIVLWQRTENRLLALESELQTLYQTLSESTVNAKANVSSTTTNQNTDREDHPATLSSLETNLFRFEVSDNDKALITAVAASSDSLVQELYEDLGITASVDPNEKMIVRLTSMGKSRSDWTIRPYGEFLLSLPSQWEMTEKSVVEIVDSLNNELIQQFLRQWLHKQMQLKETPSQWDAMFAGLDNYFWKNQILDKTWPKHSYFIDRRRFAQNQPLHMALSPTSLLSADEEWYGNSGSMVYYVTDPLSEFIIVEYGYNYLPALIAGFSQHQEWETLTPAVFGLSAIEFENQWHEYLKEHYPSN